MKEVPQLFKKKALNTFVPKKGRGTILKKGRNPLRPRKVYLQIVSSPDLKGRKEIQWNQRGSLQWRNRQKQISGGVFTLSMMIGGTDLDKTKGRPSQLGGRRTLP